jgi:amidase
MMSPIPRRARHALPVPLLALAFLLTGCGAAADPSAGPSPEASFAVEEATIADLQQAMESGTLTSRSLTAAYLARIEALDQQGPTLRAMIGPQPRRPGHRRRAGRRAAAGRVRGPLHGIPVVLKDNIDTADRMATTAGSRALEGSIAPRDAFVAERLRAAGAVILGKANLSEWANFRSTRSSSGWSGRGGQVRNPYALDRSPCGSSSGSAVAVAANLAPLAVGTETDGSIVCPAGVNGMVGIKPTIGLVSRPASSPSPTARTLPGP